MSVVSKRLGLVGVAAMLSALLVWRGSTAALGTNYLDDSRPTADRVDALLSQMTLSEKVGQMDQILIDHVIIVGNVRTATGTIERELQLHAGDPLGREAIFDSQRRLSALGLFRRVNITEVAHGEERRRDLLVTVEEASMTTIAYGGGPIHLAVVERALGGKTGVAQSLVRHDVVALVGILTDRGEVNVEVRHVLLDLSG